MQGQCVGLLLPHCHFLTNKQILKNNVIMEAKEMAIVKPRKVGDG